MAVNQFVARNGIISLNDLQVTGSIYASGNVTAVSLIKSGGTSSQFLKADGSIDNNTYLTSSTGVTTFSAGTTGLTPSSATSGAITLAGTLGAGNGGTGYTSLASLAANSAFSTTYLGISATAANSTLWNSLAYYGGALASSVLYMMVYDNTNTRQGVASAAQIQSFLGLGSNAYTSTAFLPLAGGTLTGGLNGTTATFSGALTVGGPIVRSAAGQGWLSGNYSSVETTVTTGAIYSIGGSYYPTSTSLNNMYGIGYTHTNQGQMLGSSGWGMYVASGGTVKIYLCSDNGTGYFLGDVIAYYSDKRLKTNIRPIENALSKVMQIGGYFYNPNDLAIELGATQDRDERVGVMAQEVQAVLPHAIKDAPFDRTGTYMTVQYDKLVPLLIEAIKEQQKQIDELKSQINK